MGGLVKHSFLGLCVVLSFSYGVICWIYFGWPDSFPNHIFPKLHSLGEESQLLNHLTKKGRCTFRKGHLIRDVQKAHQRNPWGILLTGYFMTKKVGTIWFVSSHLHIHNFPTICQKHIDGFRNPANIWVFFKHTYASYNAVNQWDRLQISFG